MKILAWHFINNNGRLSRYWHGIRLDTGPIATPGKLSRISGVPKPCLWGLHSSRRILDALKYARGSICCRVEVSGTVREEEGKLCSTRRKILAMMDISTILHEFSCDVAEQALKMAEVTDARSWVAIEVKRKWLRGEATDGDLNIARDAAWAAAGDAAGDAARAAAGDAARAAAARAAEAIAWDAAWDAAWGAAGDAAGAAAARAAAARATLNDELEQKVLTTMFPTSCA